MSINTNTNETSKELTIEELEKLEAEAALKYKELNEKLTRRKIEEKAAKQAKLEENRAARYREVREAYEQADKLCQEYVKDYGRIEIPNSLSRFYDAVWDRFFF